MSINKNPKFDRNSVEPVWYLAHPLATDELYTYDQNMEHVVTTLRFLIRDCKLRVMAPYHTMCLALDDADDEERRIGLETDLTIVRQTNRVILAGHKISSGMTDELLATVKSSGYVWNFVGLNRRAILETKEVRDHIAAFTAREADRSLGGKGVSFLTDRPLEGQYLGDNKRRCISCGQYV